MAGLPQNLADHLKSGLTTLSRAWSIRRMDGQTLGFTDHDMDLAFDGITFKADSGLSAMALQQSTGLSVDNTEALGALSDASIREEDIEAGRFDNAKVEAWLVNWTDTDQRWLQFRGSIGEMRRAGGAFQADLRGLTEALNHPIGRVYQKPCTAVLGDPSCGFDLETPGFFALATIASQNAGQVFRMSDPGGFAQDWFARGKLTVMTGVGQSLWGAIKRDWVEGTQRVVELWQPIRAQIASGDTVRLTAGCDKRSETCRVKFENYVNFQGFPDIPGEDWIMSYPKKTGANTGGSLR